MNISLCNAIKDAASAPLSSSLKREFQLVDNSQCNFLPAGGIKNDLLATLSAEDLEFLMPHLEFVYIPFDKKLFEYGEKMTYVYFPTTAIIGLLYSLADGNTTEIAVVGREGLLGISAMLGESALGTAMVQSAGYAYKLKVSTLKEACIRIRKLQQLLMRYIQTLFEQMAQNSVSSRHYSVDQQLSRWLLNRLDRMPANVLKITQSTIASMLGFRRESITAAARRLQQKRLIQYRRGSITVLNRPGLETYAGECYLATKSSSDFLMLNGRS